MIKNTFLHIPGIGIKTEQRFWESGIHSWEDFTPDFPMRLSPAKRTTITAHLEESKQHIKSGNARYFASRLSTDQLWRIFPEFRRATVYLDIETTGLKMWGFEITTIALYNGEAIFYYVKDKNLGDFLDEIKKYQVIVTYNGKSFDIPFIEYQFGVKLNQAHIDLRHVLASLGFTGGLKRCETQLGIDRGALKDLDGFFAVLLWYDYRHNGNEKALETLLAYNIQDAVNLETLMVIAYNLKLNNTPFYRNRLVEPVLPQLPFGADLEIVARIRKEAGLSAMGDHARRP
ncbi:MAG: ribonuclease H-like domain-containing protein [Desulfobacterales bacterium]|nr:MAG: ribonuclease H-like domain-containing protein [Desulfobacterales bacterium]